jgi:glucosamine--fructose-6-phosphate aminotransferase (isomerizing)
VQDRAELLTELAEAALDLTLVFTGMGSSYDACYPAVTELAASGRPAVMLDSAELLHFRSRMLDARTLLVAVSQSGESAEVVGLVSALGSGAKRPGVVSVTNGLDNTLARLADRAFDTSAGHETGPSTMTFAGALVVMAALGRTLAGDPVTEIVPRVVADAAQAARAVQALLDDASLPDRLTDVVEGREAVVILGRGPARAAAEMGALTIKEAAGLPVESLQTAQFRHGPLELAGPGLAALIIATEPETRSLDLSLAAELVAAGAGVLLVTQERVDVAGATLVQLGPLDRAIAPAVSIVPAQLIAWRLAARSGREPGSYYRASKVTRHE